MNWDWLPWRDEQDGEKLSNPRLQNGYIIFSIDSGEEVAIPAEFRIGKDVAIDAVPIEEDEEQGRVVVNSTQFGTTD